MRIIGYIKKNIIMTTVIILLLVVQAWGIVEIPELISKLVDIGIRNQGIEDATPKVIRQSEMEKLNYFIRDKEILNNFTVEELSGGNVYKLKDDYQKQYTNYEFARAILAVQAINKQQTIAEFNIDIMPGIVKEFNIKFGGEKPEKIYEKLANMHEKDLKLVNEIIDEKLEFITEDVLLQIAAGYLIREYEILGMQGIQAKYIKDVILKMILISLGIFIANIIQRYLTAVYSAKFCEEIRNDMYEKIIGLDANEQKRISGASLINRTLYDTQIIERAVPMALKLVAYVPIVFIGAFIKISNMSSTFNLLLPSVAVMALIIGIMSFVVLVPKNKKKRKILDKINTIERDSLNNLFIIRNTGKNKQKEKFNRNNEEIKNVSIEIIESKYFATVFSELVINFAGVYILWQGGINVDTGVLGVGSLMALLDYLFQMSFVSMSVFKNAIDMISGYVSYGRCIEILKNKDSKRHEKKKIDSINKIEFKNIYFKYSSAETYIIKDFSLKIQSGEKVCIHGKNSSGKTTLLKLLLKLYPLNSGEILVNDINIDEIDTTCLRQKIGVVTQENDMFEGNIKDNIWFNNNEYNESALDNVIKMAEIKELVEEGKTIAYKGKNISGGQKQRVAIARALAVNPDVLILDNAYTALDEKTKRIIQENLRKEYANKIVIEIEKEKNMHFEYTHVLEMKND